MTKGTAPIASPVTRHVIDAPGAKIRNPAGTTIDEGRKAH